MALQYSRALSIAGFDGSGGAGILADVKTFLALGCYGMSVLTALTAQNTQGVSQVVPLAPDFVVEQLRLIVEDIGVDALKLGMLHRVEVMEALVGVLKNLQLTRIVLDPVMIAKGGAPLIEPQAIDYLKKHILPLAYVVTPNRYEAEILADIAILSRDDQMTAAKKIADKGVPVVIVKGGHVDEASTQAADYIYFEGDGFFLESERISTQNTHGTGCTFSAAITAGLAKGFSIKKALSEAKLYLQTALQQGSLYRIGHGHGPVCHGFALNQH